MQDCADILILLLLEADIFKYCWSVGFYNYTKKKATLLCNHPARQGITFRDGGKVEHLISINLAHSFRFIEGISRASLSARVEVQPCV